MRLYWGAILSIFCCVESHYVTLTHDGPVVTGATVTFVATLFEDDGSTPSGKFMFEWQDNDLPKPHQAQFGGNMTNSTWSVNYNASGPGSYEVVVRVSSYTITWWRIASQKTTVNVTPFLNGEIKFFQNGTSMDNNFVSDSKPVLLRVMLTKPDLDFVNTKYDKIQTYWFFNYSYMGSTDGLNLTYNYSNYLDKDVTVKAFVIASSPKSEKNTTTVVTMSNDITQDNKTSPAGGNSSSVLEAGNGTVATVIAGSNSNTGTNAAASTSSTTGIPPVEPLPPGININSSCIPSDPTSAYGCFKHDVSIRGEVKDVRISGNYWLRHGDMLNLSVTCTGSPPYWHCIKILTGEYNTTGKETCLKATQTQHCSVKVLHYFSEANEYTLLFIIGNQLSRTVTPVRITIYKVQKHAQLSVIIVPVSFSIVAVILIIFGVAYYIQSRNRYTVEVADFDFAQPTSDTEYKTLGERLRDAVSGAINRTQDYSDDNCGGGGGGTTTVWSPSRKYGSMQ